MNELYSEDKEKIFLQEYNFISIFTKGRRDILNNADVRKILLTAICDFRITS